MAFQRQHHAAPAHRRGDVGFLAGGEQRGGVKVGLVGRKDRLFDKERAGPPAQALQRLGVQARRVGDEGEVIVSARGR